MAAPERKHVLRSQARKMVYDVYCFMKKEVKTKQEAVKRTVLATDSSETTIRRIVKEGRGSVFKTPGRKRIKKNLLTDIDTLTHSAVRNCIHNYHITHKEMPTLEMIKKKLRKEINFTGSVHSLRRLLDNLGFRRKTTGRYRRLIIEKHMIRLRRIEFLKNIIKYRLEGRPIIYTAASYIDSINLGSKLWLDESSKWQRKPISKYQRIVIVHAGSEAGFVPNALLLFEAKTKPGDFHNDIDYNNYNKWLRSQLIPNLPPNAVLVIDNKSYHNTQCHHAPTSNAKKEDMQLWLDEKDIAYEEGMLKPQLYNLIEMHQEQHKKYSIDKIFAEHNHCVLRLPPNHPELNPLEMAWPTINQYVASKENAINAENVKKLIKQKTSTMTVNDWSKWYKRVKKIEADYIKSDRVIDLVTERFKIAASESSESSNDETDLSDESVECDDSDEVYIDEGPTPSTSSNTDADMDHLTPEVQQQSDSEKDEDVIYLTVSDG